MQQRQPRVGDIVDDYCPRERRVSDHAVVAMVVDEIRQTRCTTCDTEHEYRQAKVPASRKKAVAVLPPKPPAGVAAAPPRPAEPVPAPREDDAPLLAESPDAQPAELTVSPPEGPVPGGTPDGSVHRRLIRAVLPRIEGEVPVRQAPEFTMHRAAATPMHGRHPRAHGGQSQRQPGKGAHGARHGGARHGNVAQKSTRGGHGAQGSHGHGGQGGGRHGRPQGGSGHRRKH